METKEINWTNVSNDMYGNPRAVCHFLNFITDAEAGLSVDKKYAIACSRAVKLGGKRYTGKDYGGGVAFQSYNLKKTEKRISEMLTDTVKYKYTLPNGEIAYKDFLRIDVRSEKVPGKVKRSIHVGGVLYSYVG